ncbi:MAG TPA: cytochrome c peroxidase [Polyangia bacterium]
MKGARALKRSTTLSLLGLGAALAALPACDTPEFAPLEWQRLQTLTAWSDADPAILRGIGKPPVDLSNALVATNGYPVDDSGALSPGAALGKFFFFDPRFSGTSTGGDFLGRVRPENTRVPIGAPVQLACVSCHDLSRAAGDPLAATISIGAGSIGANTPALANVGFFPLLHWNGRFDSLWAQALVVTEVGIVQNASRLQVDWNVWRYYRDRYLAVFGENVFGVDPAVLAGVQVVPDGADVGQCVSTAPGVCAPGCVAVAGAAGCWPRFPQTGTATSRGAADVCLDPTDTSATCCVNPATTPYNCMTAADRAAADLVFVRFGKALGAFEQTLTAANAPFDQFMHEGPSSALMNKAAKRGARLFVTKGSCYNCHNTPLFSNGFFYDVAVATTGPLELTTTDCPAGNPACDCVTPGVAVGSCLPWGALTGIELLRSFPLRRNSAVSDDPADTTTSEFLTEWLSPFAHGPPDATGVPAPLPTELKWRWKTPSLRNVAVTAPYMHNGRYATLRDVIDHYNRGGDDQAPGAHPVLIKPLDLTSDEEDDLVEFLKTLTSPPWPDPISSTPALPGALP